MLVLEGHPKNATPFARADESTRLFLHGLHHRDRTNVSGLCYISHGSQPFSVVPFCKQRVCTGSYAEPTGPNCASGYAKGT